MRCPSCQVYVSRADDFCPSCGEEQRGSRLPVRRMDVAPALWRQAAPALARGAALVLAGIAAEWLLRSAAKRTLAGSRTEKRSRQASKALSIRQREGLSEGILAVSETVVMRRVVLRR